MARPLGAQPPLGNPWGFVFCSPAVQEVMREAWSWPNSGSSPGSYLYYAFFTAMAFSERPKKRSNEACLFLNDHDYSGNGWFFRLCAAVCIEQTNTSTESRIAEAFATGRYVGPPTDDWLNPPGEFVAMTVKEMETYLEDNYSLKVKPGTVSVIMNRLRVEHATIMNEWEQKFPGFFSPIPQKEFFPSL